MVEIARPIGEESSGALTVRIWPWTETRLPQIEQSKEEWSLIHSDDFSDLKPQEGQEIQILPLFRNASAPLPPVARLVPSLKDMTSLRVA